MSIPQYIKDAQNAYNAKFDLVQLKLPKGTKERIKAVLEDGQSMAGYCVQAVLVTLESDEDLLSAGGQTEIDDLPRTQSRTAPISPRKEECEEIPKTPEKAENKANEEPVDIYSLQAELEAKREDKTVC